ncbi:hypothetical protein PAXRUDRAFT_22574 [Paxillus rubicundulus Ve08.2h10]|uniref:Zn(2)-C6 fungal-type domain-containing protein n=1 Tax=Paxillus rubicundulus Ve08.2h10 TaxID=930991 RepID=A0A0D0CXB0_9AGAM|nr:hypothetical protein PAXRUDRAFT_22574 [Paxillus rubicundulus Ve08.2h10]
MEAGGSKVEGKQVSDGNQGGKGGEKGKKKEKKEKKEKKIERVEKGFDGGGDLGPGTAKEHRGRTRERKPKKHSRTQSQSQSMVSKPRKITDAQDHVQPEASTSSNPATTRALLEAPTPPPFNNACNRCIWQTKDCTRRLEKGILVGACLPCHKGKVACNLSRLVKRPRGQSRAPVQALEPPEVPSLGPSKGPTRPSTRATSKPPVTPSKQAPSLGPGPSPSKKAKVSVSRLRPKMPSLTQKAKFANDVGVTPLGSIKVNHPLAGPPPCSIPRASALELIAMPVNPLLDP